MKARLLRTCDSEFGVFGHLDLLTDTSERIVRFYSLEEDWWDNAPHVSAIPAGRYVCRRTVLHEGVGETFEVTGVPKRSRILFHSGNTEEATRGCILLGTGLGALTVPDEDARSHPLRTKWALTGSRAAFAQFLKETAPIDTFELDVVWSTPGEWRLRPTRAPQVT